MKMNRLLLLPLAGFFILGACSKDKVIGEEPAQNVAPNILLIIADDLGKSALSGYSEGVLKANTPHLNSLRTSGLSFSNFWVNPTCSPTRASIITGKYGYRTGVKWAGDVLSDQELTVHKALKQLSSANYSTALVGKWHLSGGSNSFNPESMGIDYYAGLLGGAVSNYYQWQFSEDGLSFTSNTYVTEAFTDLAIDWVQKQDDSWFLWLAYNAPHSPFHAPPGNMHSQSNLPSFVNGMDEMPYYLAAIEAMDFQIGRLLSSISDDDLANTIIIFLGDNGAPNEVAQTPYSSGKVKGSLFQGGVNTPLFISGKGVNRLGTDSNLINATDIYASILDIAGLSSPSSNDSKSFKSLLSVNQNHRDFIYSEKDNGADQWTIRNERYKFIESDSLPNRFYDLFLDPYENIGLLGSSMSQEEKDALSLLKSELDLIRN